MNYREKELQHFGILGMKWGVRRYQNEDGSLTAAGQKRYNRVSKKLDKLQSDIDSTYEKYASQKDKKIAVLPKVTSLDVLQKTKAYETVRKKGAKFVGEDRLKKVTTHLTPEDYVDIAKKLHLSKKTITDLENILKAYDQRMRQQRIQRAMSETQLLQQQQINQTIYQQQVQQVLNTQMQIQQQQQIVQNQINAQLTNDIMNHQIHMQMHNVF